MKHIKSYTLYERVSKETKLFEWVNSSIIETVKDLLLDLQDDDIPVSVGFDTLGGLSTTTDIISIFINRNNEKLFKPVSYKEQLDSVKEFLESEGYKFYLFHWNAGFTDGGFTEAFRRSNFEYGSLSGDELFNKIYDVSFTRSSNNWIPGTDDFFDEEIENTTKYIELYFK